MLYVYVSSVSYDEEIIKNRQRNSDNYEKYSYSK